MPKVLNFRVLIEQDEDGIFVAKVPSIPGCHTQGKTYEQAVERIKEAIELCLEVAKDDSSYKSKIDFSQGSENRFIGVTEIPVKFTF